MSVFTNKMQWYRFLKIITSWLGTPYGHFQYVKGKGADCGLWIAACLQEFGILQRITYKYYPRFWHMVGDTEVVIEHIIHFIKNNFTQGFTLNEVDTLQRGDIITFRWGGELINHLGLYIGNDMMINSVNKRGVCIIPVYQKRIAKIYRVIKA